MDRFQRSMLKQGLVLHSRSSPVSGEEAAPGLIKATLLQVVLDDDVSDGVKDELHVLGVRRAGEVGVDLFGILASVQVFEAALNVGGGLLVRVGAWSGGGGQRRVLAMRCVNET